MFDFIKRLSSKVASWVRYVRWREDVNNGVNIVLIAANITGWWLLFTTSWWMALLVWAVVAVIWWMMPINRMVWRAMTRI